MCVSLRARFAYYTTPESQGARNRWKHKSAGLKKKTNQTKLKPLRRSSNYGKVGTSALPIFNIPVKFLTFLRDEALQASSCRTFLIQHEAKDRLEKTLIWHQEMNSSSWL